MEGHTVLLGVNDSTFMYVCMYICTVQQTEFSETRNALGSLCSMSQIM